MGRVQEQLAGLLQKQLQDHGIVVWYDPERAYESVWDHLDLGGVPALALTRGFFELRSRLEPYLEPVQEDGGLRADAAVAPKLLVYVPLARAASENALIEAESAGIVVEPGASSWQRNTRLKVIAERVFKEIAPDRATDIARQAEQGSFTLADLERLSEESADIGAGSLKLIFETTSAAEIAIVFAASPRRDDALREKRALPELMAALLTGLGMRLQSEDPVSLRVELRRALLLGDLVLSLPGEHRGGALASVPLPAKPAHREALRAACASWRNRQDLRAGYLDAAKEVEEAARLAGLGLDPEALAGVETFPFVEPVLLLHAEQRILDGKPGEAETLAGKRKSGLWAQSEAATLLRWSLVETAARLVSTAERVRQDLKRLSAKARPQEMVDAYVAHPHSWSTLDTLQRHLERQYAAFDLDGGDDHDLLERVVQRARRQYVEAAGECADVFFAALERSGFEIDGVLPQEEIFLRMVAPKRGAGRIAYLWVDALRFEMARELIAGLDAEFDISVRPAIARLPSITEVGMAALVPGAERGMDLLDAGDGHVAVKIGATVLENRASRLKHVHATSGFKVHDLKLNELMKPKKSLKDEIAKAELVLVTSQEIDRRGEETSDEEEARRYVDEVLEKLRRGVRRLAELGVTEIVIAADHGHLFVDGTEDAMRIAPPGGKQVDLHRRVWVGRGGGAAPGYVRVSATAIGMGGDLELAFPRGLACFRSGGSVSFFHGATSLQEMVIPVVTLVPRKLVKGTDSATVAVEMERPRITTRLFSVSLTYRNDAMFAPETLRVFVVARSGKKDLGSAATAVYGFEEGTREVTLERNKPNVVTLMLSADSETKALSVQVLDAATQVGLGIKDGIPVAISV